MSNVTAVIAAGGYGSRCSSMMPKALLNFDEKTYLEMMLIECRNAGVDNGIIYCNRENFLNEIRKITKNIASFEIVLDAGVKSTFELITDAAKYSSSQKLLFCYGHAPRPSAHIEEIIRFDEAVVVSVVKTTTKKHAVIFRDDHFVEPPYLLSRSLLATTNATTWANFFDQIGGANGVMLHGPGEFNSREDKTIYDRYLRSWLRSLRGRDAQIRP
jgi:CTP:molybdopterin cytidylyltransferase MocA